MWKLGDRRVEICEGNLCLLLRGNEQIACAAVKIVGSPSTEAQDLPSHASKSSWWQNDNDNDDNNNLKRRKPKIFPPMLGKQVWEKIRAELVTFWLPHRQPGRWDQTRKPALSGFESIHNHYQITTSSLRFMFSNISSPTLLADFPASPWT